MRTLKKTLCLVLAVVMVLGLCAVSVSAADVKDFSDSDKIQYTEAVNVLTGLGIIEGMNDGTFSPNTNLTRAQACVIITKLLGMQSAAVAKDTFTDTENVDWARKYIGFCQQQGIVSGYGNGKFGPNDQLTGAQWALMLLHAVGYDDTFEGIGGTQWEIAVAKLVRNTKLDNGLEDFDLTAPLTRDQACQMAFTAATNDVPNPNSDKDLSVRRYVDGGSVTTGSGSDVTVSLTGGYDIYADSLLKLSYGNNIAYGVITANQANSLDAYTSVKDKKGNISWYNVETGEDMIGHQVKIYFDGETYKNEKNTGEVFAVVDQTVEVPISGKESASELKGKLNAAGVTSGTSLEEYVSNGKINKLKDAVTITLDATDGTEGEDIDDYSAILVYTNDDNESSIIGLRQDDTYSVEYVSARNNTSGKETITLSSSGKKENNASKDEVRGDEGLAVKDIVLVYTCGDITVLYTPEQVTGAVTAKSTGKNPAATIGKSYSVNKDNGVTEAGKTLGDVTSVAVAGIKLGDEYTLYLDKDGKIALITGVSVDGDVVYVVTTYAVTPTTAYGDSDKEYYVQGVTTDGEEVNYRVYSNGTKYYLDKDESGEISSNTIYTVTVAYDDADGIKADMATLKALSGNKGSVQNTGTNAITKKDVSAKANSNYYFASDVQFIYVDGTKDKLKVAVKNGLQEVAASTTYTIYGTKANDTATKYDVHYVFVKAAGSDSTQTIGYASEGNGNVDDAVSYVENGSTKTGYKHTVYVDGEKTTIITGAGKNAKLNGWFKLTTDEDTGVTTAETYAGNSEETLGTKVLVSDSGVYNGYLTTADVSDASLADTKIVDLSKNDIETVDQLKDLVDSGAKVTVSYMYDSTETNKPVAYLYVESAEVDVTLTQSTTTLTSAITTSLSNIDKIEYSWTKDKEDVEDEENSTLTISETGTYKVSVTITLNNNMTVKGSAELEVTSLT